MTSERHLRVLICDRALLVRDGLRTLLDAEPDIEAVDTTDSGLHAMMLARARHPHVVITGLSLNSISGLELIRRLRAENLDPSPQLIAFVPDERDAALVPVLQAGASGVLTGDTSRDELVATVRAVTQGHAMIPPGATQLLLQWIRRRDNLQPVTAPPNDTAPITPREREVLELTARGLSTQELADELSIGVATVRTHIYRLQCKLQAKDRAQLVAFAFRYGLMRSA